MHGRWDLQEDGQLSGWAWEHIKWILRHGKGICHPEKGELGDAQTENIFSGSCQDPYSFAVHNIYHGDDAHLHNFLREDIAAHGVAIYTQEYFNRYLMIFAWRARKNS